MRSPDMLAAALGYAQGGWAVFPCAPGGKRPLTEHGLTDATADPDQIAAWWQRWPAANVAIATGASGLVVIDLDLEKDTGEPVGIKSYGKMLLKFGDPGPAHLPDGASVETGPGNAEWHGHRWRGKHLYFRAPSAALRPRTGALPGIDVRAGGSYVIAPPSLHPSGCRYGWLDEVPPDGLPQLAPAWVDLLHGEHEPPPAPAAISTPPIRDGHHGTKYGRAALAGLLRDLAGIGVGARNHATYTACRRVLDLHAAGHLPDAGAALDLVAEVARETGLSAAEVDKTRVSALNGARETTYA